MNGAAHFNFPFDVDDLPLDVQKAEIDYDPGIDSSLEVTKPVPDSRGVRRAMDMMLQAERPIMLLGGGVIIADACQEFVELAEYLSVPVVTSLMGKGGIADDHPLYAGQIGTICNTPYGNKAFHKGKQDNERNKDKFPENVSRGRSG